MKVKHQTLPKNKKKHKAIELFEKIKNGSRKQQAKTPKTAMPPPIILSNVKDYKVMKEKL